jgi:hypothetical protein
MLDAGVAAGGALGLLHLQLTNAKSGEAVEGTAPLFGAGPKLGLGVGITPWSSPTSFYTHDKVNFEDFQHNWIQYFTVGASGFIGYERAYISFSGLGPEAWGINVSGATLGTAGLGLDLFFGLLTLNTPLPPRLIPVEHSDEAITPYERSERGEDAYTVLFDTWRWELSPPELAILESFIGSVVAMRQ